MVARQVARLQISQEVVAERELKASVDLFVSGSCFFDSFSYNLLGWPHCYLAKILLGWSCYFVFCFVSILASQLSCWVRLPVRLGIVELARRLGKEACSSLWEKVR